MPTRHFILVCWLSLLLPTVWAASYQPPFSPRLTLDFNRDWRFYRGDVTNATDPLFDDTAWSYVSTPHTFNDVDTFDNIITKGGERDLFEGVTWYRKHFTLPIGAKAGKAFLEFEGLRQAAWFYLNGQLVGTYENGVTACGIDITAVARYGAETNVLAVKVDNSHDYREAAT
ncbi:MAG TPA: beta galactosidase jelly roll domain-containing protein, partial [Verrucomicrobiae bacterium]